MRATSTASPCRFERGSVLARKSGKRALSAAQCPRPRGILRHEAPAGRREGLRPQDLPQRRVLRLHHLDEARVIHVRVDLEALDRRQLPGRQDDGLEAPRRLRQEPACRPRADARPRAPGMHDHGLHPALEGAQARRLDRRAHAATRPGAPRNRAAFLTSCCRTENFGTLASHSSSVARPPARSWKRL